MATNPLYQNYVTDNRPVYLRSPRHAVNWLGLNQDQTRVNHPRLAFEFYVTVRFNDVGSARPFVSRYFGESGRGEMLTPVVKSVDMPSFKVDTQVLDQYNRKRISQTRVNFDPVKMVFHDVVDGKTLKFWDLYYTYYFGDGIEPGMNAPSGLNTGSGLGSANLASAPYTTVGEKRNTNTVISDQLNSHIFGYNLSRVKNIKNLIHSIEIYQVHGRRCNQVTLVNPRISSFTHDTLDYAEGSKALSVSMTFDYEYAYYTLYDQVIGGGESWNPSDLTVFKAGGTVDRTPDSFRFSLYDYNGGSPLNDRVDGPYPGVVVGGQRQDPIGGLLERASGLVNQALAPVTNLARDTLGVNLPTGGFPIFADVRAISSSVLNGALNQLPAPVRTLVAPAIGARSFASAAAAVKGAAIRNIYRDITRAQ